MATLRGPSVAEELLEPLAGSKPAVSDDSPTVICPPGLGCLPDGCVVVVAWTLRRLAGVLGDVCLPVVALVFRTVVVLFVPGLVVLVVPFTTAAVVEVEPDS